MRRLVARLTEAKNPFAVFTARLRSLGGAQARDDADELVLLKAVLDATRQYAHARWTDPLEPGALSVAKLDSFLGEVERLLDRARTNTREK